MMKILLLLIFVSLASTNEHWFSFDRQKFPGFYSSLFTLTTTKGKSLSFALSTYDRSILVEVLHLNSTETIKLNIERADFLYNTFNHMIFIAIREEIKVETYVNCKLIDSYFFYTPTENSSSYQIKEIANHIEHYEIKSTSQFTQRELFDMFSCKQTDLIISSNQNSTSIIGRPLIRKMHYVIEKVQRRKLRSRRNNQQHLPILSSDSFTIIYKPKMDNNLSPHPIFNIPQLKFHIQYYPNEHLLNIRFNNENRTQLLLYTDKSTDRIFSSNNSLILFLHVTSTMITCYVNCELIDQEFIIDTFYIQNLIQQIITNNNHYQYEYNHQSTLILFNQSIDQIAANFYCLKLDKKHQDLLPDKYALRKFTNALDMLVNSLDNSHHEKRQDHTAVNIPSSNTQIATPSISMIEYKQFCSTDDDCNTNQSLMKCQSGQCNCPNRSFWSLTFRRCLICHDILLGNRCFRLSNHKSTWYESNNYCEDNQDQEYSMKLASNLNQTDIQYFRQHFLHDNDYEHIDYMYWIGATSQFETRKVHSRTKRQIPTTTFRWYDNGETAQLNHYEIWCSQMDYMGLTTINNNQLCVSMTSCGLYADDCQRNNRFLCEAV